jgi:hypothetical protein
MDGGSAFDPGGAVYDGKCYWLWDGFHRFHAERRRGSDTMVLEVTKGTLDDARRLSLGANKEHRGMRRTNRDKRRAVERALAWFPGYSAGKVAELCGVSVRFVTGMRNQQPTLNRSELDVVIGRDGRTRNVSNIGKAPAPAPKAPAPATFAELQKLTPPAPPAEGVLQPEQQPQQPSPRPRTPEVGVTEMDFAQYMRNIQGTANHLTHDIGLALPVASTYADVEHRTQIVVNLMDLRTALDRLVAELAVPEKERGILHGPQGK